MNGLFAESPPVKKRGISGTLIIIGILLLGFLVWFFGVPVLTQIKTRAAHLRIRAVMNDLDVGTGHYRAEYERLPIIPADATADTEFRSSGDFIQALLGENPRQIKFVDIQPAKNGKFGLLESSAVGTLVDLWGEPYYLVLDTNKDNRIRNPEGGVEINDFMIIYSAGPDGDPETWADNIKDWR